MSNKQSQIPQEFRASNEELDEYRENVIRYMTSMAVVKNMYKQGIVDKDDFTICDKLMADKYGISDKSIYRCKDPDDS